MHSSIVARQALKAPSVSPGLKLNSHPHLIPRLRRDKLKSISFLHVVFKDNCNLRKSIVLTKVHLFRNLLPDIISGT